MIWDHDRWALRLFIAVVVVWLGTCVARHADRDVVAGEVTSKDVTHSGEKSRYLVWVRDAEVLSLDDSMVEGQWDTSDDYGAIVVGRCYRFEVYGWRVPLFSMYRNIVSMREVSCGSD